MYSCVAPFVSEFLCQFNCFTWLIGCPVDRVVFLLLRLLLLSRWNGHPVRAIVPLMVTCTQCFFFSIIATSFSYKCFITQWSEQSFDVSFVSLHCSFSCQCEFFSVSLQGNTCCSENTGSGKMKAFNGEKKRQGERERKKRVAVVTINLFDQTLHALENICLSFPLLFFLLLHLQVVISSGFFVHHITNGLLFS